MNYVFTPAEKLLFETAQKRNPSLSKEDFIKFRKQTFEKMSVISNTGPLLNGCFSPKVTAEDRIADLEANPMPENYRTSY